MLGKIYVIYIRIHKIKYEYDANHQLNLIKFVAWSHICTQLIKQLSCPDDLVCDLTVH